MNNTRIALSMLALGAPALAFANQSDHKTAEHYRCISQQACQFEQWFVNASFGSAQGDITQQDVIDDAAALGFNVFDVEIDDTRSAYKIGAGLHLMEHWELEGGYLDLGDVSAAFSTTTTEPDDFFGQTNTIHPLSADGLYVSAKYKIIDNIDWQLSLKAGVFFWSGDYDSLNVFDNVAVTNLSDDNGSDLFLGVGAAYGLTKQLNLIADIERYKIGDEHTLLWSAGLRYYF